MDAIFSPSRSTVTEFTENTPMEHTAKQLFKESVHETLPKSKSRPLSTITNLQINQQQQEDEEPEKVRSPSLQNVSQLKNWITKMEKENKHKQDSAWKKPKNMSASNTMSLKRIPTSRNPSRKVKEMREKIVEHRQSTTSTPVQRARDVQVTIPMNKVQEMRKILLDFRQRQNQQKEQMYMSSKKRAKIDDRLNRVEDIQRWLNEMERHSKKTNNSNSSQSKATELNLPMNRVSDMKNWLIEFGKQNKEHCNRFTTRSAQFDRYNRGSGVYTTSSGTPKRGSETSEKNQVDGKYNNDDNFSMPDVSELAKFLSECEEENNKAQSETTPMTNVDITQRCDDDVEEEDEAVVDCSIGNNECVEDQVAHDDKNAHTDDEDVDCFDNQGKEREECTTEANFFDNQGKETEDDEHYEEDLEQKGAHCGKDFEGAVIVENTSIIEDESHKVDVNISMMPITNNMDESEWEDDYAELAHVDINIEPVQSQESWEDESFGSSEKNNGHVDENQALEQRQNSSRDSQADMNDYDTDVTEEEIWKEKEDESDELKPALMEKNESFKGMSTEYSRDSSEDDDVDSVNEYTASDLLGETFLNTSLAGPRFSSSFVGPTATITEKEKEVGIGKENDCSHQSTELVEKKSKKGFKCLFKSFTVFAKKKEIDMLPIEEEGTEMSKYYIATQKEKYSQNTACKSDIMQTSTRSLDLSPDSHCHGQGFLPDVYSGNVNDLQDVTKTVMMSPKQGYLPSAYGCNDDEPQDFAREMVLSRGGYSINPSTESPMSLASAFRRSMSPSSSCTGSELSDGQAMILGNLVNVSQHVGWLKGHFQSPKDAEVEKNNFYKQSW
mmetsp:Transcript_15319/g.18643  ORF Transcript_15319/g.18643 Transcript_15319/m.18643 type:complete len:838 (-) Transcript_15319:200-2713(-)